MQRAAGTLIGSRFVRERELGRGAFGQAFLVSDSEEGAAGAQYALKVIDLSALTPKMRVAAQAEVGVLEKLLHVRSRGGAQLAHARRARPSPPPPPSPTFAPTTARGSRTGA